MVSGVKAKTIVLAYDPKLRAVVLRHRFDTMMKDALKSGIRSEYRGWDSLSRQWLFDPNVTSQVERILTRSGFQVEFPGRVDFLPVSIEAVKAEIRYFGSLKTDNRGEYSNAWYRGGWNAVIMAKALRFYFKQNPGSQSNTLYSVLGVANSATPDEIKSAWRRSAKQWHPDVCSEPNAKMMFQQIQTAYETLADADKRHRYDGALLMVKQSALNQMDPYRLDSAWQPPIRCGVFYGMGELRGGKLTMREIHKIEDIVRADGKTLVSSWIRGKMAPVEQWV